MFRRIPAFICMLCVIAAAAPLFGFWQDAAPATTKRRQTPDAVLAANKQLVIDFFGFRGPREERAQKFMAPDYVQHNARFLRMDETDGAHGNQAWVAAQAEATRRGGIRLVDLPGIPLRDPIILMAEGDLGHAVYRGRRPDPDAPGQTYEVFAFESFRFRNGQFSEHWDQVPLSPGWSAPAPPQGPGGRGGTASPAIAPEPMAGCPSTPRLVSQNKRAVAAFLDTAAVAKNASGMAKFLSDGFEDHDPRFAAFDRKENFSGRAAFVKAVESGLDARPAPATKAVSPRSKQMTIGECNYVSVVWKQILTDPDMPGRTWEAFTFDTFRLDRGLIAEHWNGASR